MDIQTIISAIGSVGFPIVACVGIFYLYDKTIKELVNTQTHVIDTLHSVNDTLQRIDEKLDNVSS
jgi:hypothetical protein